MINDHLIGHKKLPNKLMGIVGDIDTISMNHSENRKGGSHLSQTIMDFSGTPKNYSI